MQVVAEEHAAHTEKIEVMPSIKTPISKCTIRVSQILRMLQEFSVQL